MAVAKQKSASVSHRHDQTRKDERIRRTRSRIDAAFVELLHRRAYGNIRVNDITRKAHIGRATFYAHYPDKDTLLRSQFDRIVAPMIGRSPGAFLVDATAFFDHIRTSPQIYRAFMGPEGGSAPGVLRDCFEARVRQLLQLNDAKPGLRQFAVCRFVAASLLTVVECWLEKGGRETPQEIQALLNNLIGPGVRSFAMPS